MPVVGRQTVGRPRARKHRIHPIQQPVVQERWGDHMRPAVRSVLQVRIAALLTLAPMLVLYRVGLPRRSRWGPRITRLAAELIPALQQPVLALRQAIMVQPQVRVRPTPIRPMLAARVPPARVRRLVEVRAMLGPLLEVEYAQCELAIQLAHIARLS